MNIDLLTDTYLTPFNEEVISRCEPFSCGDEDLDEFFMHDALLYEAELLGKTYCFITKQLPYRIVGAFTLANDSIKTMHLEHTTINRLNRPIDNAKRGRSYPATLIGRLGVNILFRGAHAGTQVIDFLKDWLCDDDTKAGCRFLVVDAYNRPEVLRFYENNKFRYLHKNEDEEREYYHVNIEEPIHTRLMYFDLKSKR